MAENSEVENTLTAREIEWLQAMPAWSGLVNGEPSVTGETIIEKFKTLAVPVPVEPDICGTCDGIGCPVCRPVPEPGRVAPDETLREALRMACLEIVKRPSDVPRLEQHLTAKASEALRAATPAPEGETT